MSRLVASFEISFRTPIDERNLFTANGQKSPEAETLEEVGALLTKGLKWLTSAAAEVFASALAGNKRADLVGEHTIGRAAVLDF